MEESFEEQRRVEKARKKVHAIKGFYKHFAAYIIVNTVVIIMHLADREPGEDFFSWGMLSMPLCWGLGLLIHAFGVFGTDAFFGADWEDRKIREYMDKNAHKKNEWE